MKQLEDDRSDGIRHAHDWQPLTRLPGLQSAHDRMRWDCSKSRLLSVNVCTVCGDHDAGAVEECTVVDCHEHRICDRPYH